MLIGRHDLVATLDRAAGKRVTIISAPAGSGKTSLLHEWAERPAQDSPIAFMTVQPGQHEAQLFWLTLLGAVRVATGSTEPVPPPAPGFNGQAMVDRVLSELEASGGPLVLIIDDLHELRSAEAAGQLTMLLTRLPAGVHAIVATRRDPPLRLHQLRLAGELAEIRAAPLRFTEDETRELLAAAGITLPDPVVAMLHQRTEGWAKERSSAATVPAPDWPPWAPAWTSPHRSPPRRPAASWMATPWVRAGAWTPGALLGPGLVSAACDVTITRADPATAPRAAL